MSCRGRAAAAIVKEPNKEPKMPRISNAFLIAMLSLVPAAWARPASAFVQLADAQDGAATASEQHDAASLSQERIQEIFFDAARKGRDELLDGLIQSGMNPDERDPHGYTTLIPPAYNAQAKTADFLIQKRANPCASDAKSSNSLIGDAGRGAGMAGGPRLASAARSETFALPAAGWAILPPSRRKGRRPIRWRYATRCGMRGLSRFAAARSRCFRD